MASPHLHNEYKARINRVLDDIDRNISKKLTIRELAEQAHFSPFHFHRIFGAIMGEPLMQFINRVRLQRAASRLVTDPRLPITDVAFEYGFSGSAPFARAFKEFFGMSASRWREGGYAQRKLGKTDSKICKTKSKDRQDMDGSLSYITALEIRDGASREEFNRNIQRMGFMDVKDLSVEVKELESFTVAYIRHVGPYKGDSELFKGLWGKLMAWAGPRGLVNPPETKIICVYHDDPEVTEAGKLRTSVCVSVPEDTAVDGEVGKMTIDGGKYALARFELKPDEYQAAWTAVFGAWLPQSGYQPADGACFEWYHSNCEEHPEKKAVLDICVPVKPL